MSKQKLSLQEQLLKSGLATKAQAKTVHAEKLKQTQRQRKNHIVVEDDAKQLALQAQAEKIERDKALNQQRNQQEQHKQVLAQIKQLIELNRLALDNSDDSLAFHFNDNNKMKTLYVSDLMRQRLINGDYAIVKSAETYAVVSAEIGIKIQERDAGSLVLLNEQVKAVADDNDPYAAFAIPDDLVW
ncbi:DUF2058 domain-containing protein [Methylocucumis oryzae]|uniref:Nucleoprotein/polynucleotide-associated enzyme n=1 Tax=Methylocucumis oryzae TaxID=1632867 RepID=A0A0F3IGC2_9GAMM|nr:DUF2058 domain-containing protein [Methylocucumis oryzae]KJV05850.1 nucleoprotein/polynucleotide-associated enzyme [Methylocucumis oryzae]